MNPDRPMIFGDHVFNESGAFNGMIGGDATVAPGVTLSMAGMIGGDLIVRSGATVHLRGIVAGELVTEGGATVLAA
ncbi:hypothetical protein [Paracoccus sp. (in: a-proteobacteria)]|uniref:hypothetical protein n=1 Tax=Paracoccus sp. TaxID=267 RepID=UPI003A88BE7F